jgi:osmotically inducible protein OsmC
MPERKAKAVWEGNLQQGKGRMALGSGAYEGAYSFQTRMGDEPGSNPEELIGAALAGCFSMALSADLAKAGASPERIQTDARVHFEQEGARWTITFIELATEVEAKGLEDGKFQAIAEETKQNCPVARALAATEIRLKAHLTARA